jgi:hypothetical protein
VPVDVGRGWAQYGLVTETWRLLGSFVRFVRERDPALAAALAEHLVGWAETERVPLGPLLDHLPSLPRLEQLPSLPRQQRRGTP